MPRYYIYDANGNPFGNIKGYNKFSSAKGTCTRYSAALWDIYDTKTVRDNNLIWAIKLENKCRIPDDCIDSRRYPLFMARDVMHVLIEQLQAEGATPS